MRATDYLDTLDIDVDSPDETRSGWKDGDDDVPRR